MKNMLSKGLHALVMCPIVLTLMVAAKPKQFPDDNTTYIPNQHVGMSPYKSQSLYGTNKISLTYDDGPHPVHTAKILDVLKEYNAKATFFVLTANINEQTMPIIERIVNEGHNLASHDHDHDNNNNEPETQYRTELTQTVTKIESILDSMGVHQREMYYRFPYGAYGKNKLYHHMNVMKQVSQVLYGDNCINFAFWDIDTADWVPSMTSADVAQTFRAYMEGGRAYTFKRENGAWKKVPYSITKPLKGGVALMHDIHAKNIEGTRLILEDAKAKNWEVVPLSSVKEFDYGNKECIFHGN